MNEKDSKEAVKPMMSKKTKRQLIIGILLILSVIVMAGYTLFFKKAQPKEIIIYNENKAMRGNLEANVTESGSLEFGITTQVYDLDVSTENEEDEEDEEENHYLKVEEVYVALGQNIKTGDKIYKFTENSINDVRKNLTYAKTEAQIAMDEAQSEYEVGVKTASLTQNETNLDTALAQLTYDNTIAQLSTQSAALSLEIEQLLADIYNIQCDLVDDDYLDQKSEIISAYDKAIQKLEDASEQYVTNKVTAFESFKSAKNSYDQFFKSMDESNQSINDKIDEINQKQEEIEYNNKIMEKELLSAKQELELSNINGEIAGTVYQSSLTSYESNLSKAEKELEEITGKLDAFETFIGDGTVYAEGTGVITEVGFEKDDYLVNTGNLISFAKAEDMTISVDVSQEDVVTIKVGDKVNIGFTAYEGEEYSGIVKSITTTATSRNSDIISYPVVISVQGDTSKLFSGMTADVTFKTDSREDVVYILRKALVTENGKKCVYVKDGDEYILKQVKTGFTDSEYIEITEGLSDGDTYYISTISIAGEKGGSEDDSEE